MRKISGNNRPSVGGFTLIELMITVAIVGIIAAIALPSYRSYVMRANRAAAATYLLELANMQERYFLEERQYTSSLTDLGTSPPSEVSGNYDVSVSAIDNAATPPTYTLSAAIKSSGGQVGDSCGTLTLNSLGERGHASGASRCWD